MKRPFALIGFTYFIALMVAIYFGKNTCVILAAIFLVGFVISLLIKDVRNAKIIPIAFVVAFLAFGVYYINYTFKVEPNEILDKKDVTFTGTICDMPYKSYDTYYYMVQTSSMKTADDIENIPQNIKIRISSSKALDADVYDQITADAYLFLPVDDDGFSSRTYYQSKGVYILGYVNAYEEISVEEVPQKPIYYYIIKLKQSLMLKARAILPDEQASMISGVLFGDKTTISNNVKEDFRNLGISHLLAVSGMHLAIICQFMMFLFNIFKVPERYSCLFCVFGVIFFMALTGFSSSIMRAGIMTTIYLIGTVFNKKSDSINSLAAAVLFLCILNPFSAGDIGLLLSCASTLGIILLNSPLEKIIFKKIGFRKRKNKIIYTIISAVTLSILASLFTLPIVMLSFSYVSLISPIANLLIVLPSSVMMISALIFEVFSFWGVLSFLSVPAALVSGVIAKYITWCANLISKIPFVSVPANQPFLLLCLSGALLLIAVVVYFKINLHNIKIVLLLTSIILLTGIFSYQLSIRNVTKLSILDTGDGLTAVLKRNNHGAVISCGGEKMYTNKTLNYFKDNNISKLDYILLSDSNDKNCYYAKQIIYKYKPFSVVLNSAEKILEKTGENFENCGRVTYFDKTVKTDIWENVNIKCKSDGNKSYTLILINGIKVLLCPEDVIFNNLPEDFKNCDFIVTSGDVEDSFKYNSSYIILAMNSETANKNAKKLILDENNVMATAGDGDITIDFIKDKNICIRRAI